MFEKPERGEAEPEEIYFEVFSYLDPKSLSHLLKTSRYNKELIDWYCKEYYKLKFNNTISDDNNTNYTQLYLQTLRAWQQFNTVAEAYGEKKEGLLLCYAAYNNLTVIVDRLKENNSDARVPNEILGNIHTMPPAFLLLFQKINYTPLALALEQGHRASAILLWNDEVNTNETFNSIAMINMGQQSLTAADT